MHSMIQFKPAHYIKSEFEVQFVGEQGVDGGGLRREFITIILQRIFNPNFGLFRLSDNGLSIQPNSESMFIPDHLQLFRFAGRILALALFHSYEINVEFTISLVKHMLKQTLYINDLQDIDSELTNRLL